MIPEALRPRYLEAIHAGHQGTTCCQQRARTCIYWPGINRDIETAITQCDICQKYQASQPKEKPLSVADDEPNIPWYTLGTDLFTLDGQDYLLISDYHSKFPIVEELGKDSSRQHVAKITNRIFSMFGVPHKIVSDNGPQFIGKAYQEMVNQYGISHITSSPYHPTSHGFIERAVRTVKALIRKSPRDTDAALLAHRTTPLGPYPIPSPAELLFGPVLPHNMLIQRHGTTNDEWKDKQALNQQSHQHILPELKVGQQVWYQNVAARTWSPGEVMGFGPEPRSYTLRCNDTGRHL